MVSISLRQDILIESTTVDRVIAKWNGHNTNWIFLVSIYNIMTTWVICVRMYRPKKPQGRIMMIRR